MGRKRKNEDNGGRVAKARGVSFPPEMSESIDRRLGELHPFVAGLSAYVQRLVHLDLSRGLLREDGSINEAAVLKVKDAKGGRSFNQAHNAIATPDAGVDNSDGTINDGAAGRVGVVAQLVEHHNGIVSFPPTFPKLTLYAEAGSDLDCEKVLATTSGWGNVAPHESTLPVLPPTVSANPLPADPDLLPLAA